MKNLLLPISFFASFFISCFAYGQLTEKPLGTTTSTMGYIEYLPSGYSSTSTQKLPVILFFHGSGEGGNGTTNLKNIYATGLPKLIKNNSWTYKNQFVVLMPQHNPSKQLCMSEFEIRDFIEFARQNYNVDLSRVYLTGLSCGANGLWRYLGIRPSNEKVAAAVPISGNGKQAYDAAGCNIKVPTWAFHGSADQTSPASNDIAANNSFQQCPAPHAEVKFTLYQGVDHYAWDRTYDLSAGNDIYAWMLTKTSPVALPISLTSFTAKLRDKTISLNWVTASEKNNKEFEVLKSADGKNFKVVANIDGAINSETEKYYSFIDENPYAGANYYKLNQIDLDGVSAPSNIISVNAKIEDLKLSAYASSTNVSVKINSPNQTDGEISLFDINGKKLDSKTLTLNKGYNDVVFNKSLTSGTYIIHVISAGKSTSLRFIK